MAAQKKFKQGDLGVALIAMCTAVKSAADAMQTAANGLKVPAGSFIDTVTGQATGTKNTAAVAIDKASDLGTAAGNLSTAINTLKTALNDDDKDFNKVFPEE